MDSAIRVSALQDVEEAYVRRLAQVLDAQPEVNLVAVCRLAAERFGCFNCYGRGRWQERAAVEALAGRHLHRQDVVGYGAVRRQTEPEALEPIRSVGDSPVVDDDV